MKKLNEKNSIPVIAVMMLILVGYLDFITGTELSFDLFYLGPLCLYGFHLGKRKGVLISLLAGLIWLASDIFMGHYHSQVFVHYWNAFVRFSTFAIVVLLLISLKTERDKLKNANQKLRDSYERIQEMLEMKTSFAAMVTHELRTPLVAIQESIKLIEDEISGPLLPEQREYLAMARRSAGRLSRLVDDILDFSKLSSQRKQFQMTPSDINEIVRETEIFYRPVAERQGIELGSQLAAEIPEIELDGDAIRQVISNLLGNALRFTDKGGITLRTRTKGTQVEVSVQDTGTGIRNEDLEKIFEPFTQLRDGNGRYRKGTGLGLTISKLIVEQHGGQIRVESEPGAGTTVSFTLPVHRIRLHQSILLPLRTVRYGMQKGGSK